MLHSVDKLQDYEIVATDGHIGKVRGFYFDSDTWEIHYLLVDTSKWLPGRKVLISPVEIQKIDLDNKFLSVNLTQDQIQNSPAIEEDAPISATMGDLNAYYGWRGGRKEGLRPESGFGGKAAGYSDMGLTEASQYEGVTEFGEESEFAEEDLELRGTQEVMGFYIEADDGDIGHVEDFVIDDEKWTVAFIVIDTKNWWPGKKVLVSPDWIDEIGWDDKRVLVQLSREQIKNSPEYDQDNLPGMDYEQKFYGHYREAGWLEHKEAGFDEENRRL
jgi:sporulation protein YlmC with PRC-barrel domain